MGGGALLGPLGGRICLLRGHRGLHGSRSCGSSLFGKSCLLGNSGHSHQHILAVVAALTVRST